MSLLFDEPPLLVNPRLAEIIGLGEAVVIQQLHYLIQKEGNGAIFNGEKWIYNTYEDWQRQYFRFLSVITVKRIFIELENQGLVISCQPEKGISRRKYYRINHAKLNILKNSQVLEDQQQIKLIPSMDQSPKEHSKFTQVLEHQEQIKLIPSTDQSDTIDRSNCTVEEIKLIPSIKTKTSTDIKENTPKSPLTPNRDETRPTKNPLSPEAHGELSKNLKPAPPFEATIVAGEGDDSDRFAPSIIEKDNKSSSEGIRPTSTQSEFSAPAFNSENAQKLLGKEEVLEGICRFFNRDPRNELSEVESKAFERIGRVTENDLKIVSEWMQMTSPEEAIKHRPETFLSMVRNWGRNRDRAFDRIRRFGKSKSRLESRNSEQEILAPRHLFGQIPELVPNSKIEAESDFRAVLKNLKMMMSEGSILRLKNELEPIGLRVGDKSIVIKAPSALRADFICEHFKRQIDTAANPRKVLICV